MNSKKKIKISSCVEKDVLIFYVTVEIMSLFCLENDTLFEKNKYSKFQSKFLIFHNFLFL